MRNIFFRKIVVSLFLIGISSICWADRNSLLDVVSSPMSELEVSNALFKRAKDKRFLIDLSQYWETQRLSTSTKIDQFDSDLVRLTMSFLILQGVRNCMINYETSDLRDFILEKINSDEKLVRVFALRYIGMTGVESDIEFLRNEVLKEVPGFSEAAFMSLRYIHTEKALNVIRELRNKVSGEDLHRNITEYLDEVGDNKLIKYSKYCEEKYGPPILEVER